MQVLIDREPMRRGSFVTFYDEGPGTTVIYKFGFGEDGVAPAYVDIQPDMRIPEDARMFLPDPALEALVSTARTMQIGTGSLDRFALEVFAKEQKRVDDLMNFLIGGGNAKGTS